MVKEEYYENFEIDDSDLTTSWGQIIMLAGTGHRILDIGCWTGKTAAKLGARGNVVTGIEINPDWAEKARGHCEAVFRGNVEHKEFFDSIPGKYDVIIMGDLLEHLLDPWSLVQRLPEKLSPGGYVIFSIPNIANWRPRLDLLLGRFRYKPSGITAWSHLRFFTRSSAEAMFREAGFKPEYFGVTSFRVPIFLARLVPNLFSIQFVYKMVYVRS